MTDRARPSLVAFYDILPRNGAGLSINPLCGALRSMHFWFKIKNTILGAKLP